MIAPAIGQALAAGLDGDTFDDRMGPLSWEPVRRPPSAY